MGKPQMASEPTMEEILSSIRKMISDDKPGHSPMPDPMGRALFGETSARGSTVVEGNGRSNGEGGNPARAGAAAAGAASFNSLSDALKVATTLSDQRKSLQQEIAKAIEKGPRSNLDALTELSAARSETRGLGEARNMPADNAFPMRGMPETGGEPAGPLGKAKDLLSFDFGTLVPERESAQPKPSASDAKRNLSSPTGGAAPEPDASAMKPESKPDLLAGGTVEQPASSKIEISTEPRVLPLRTGLNGSAAHGLNGSAPNISPFPRPIRDAAKPAELETDSPSARSLEDTSGPVETAAPALSEATLQPVPEAAVLKADALSAHGEALLDAVVELVQQQPGAMSVFTSGDSFIYGSRGKKPAETLPAITEASGVGVVGAEVAAEAAGPKMDRAAAELLRPMLRQWLAQNMERILEDALRSELTAQVQGEKDPSKS